MLKTLGVLFFIVSTCVSSFAIELDERPYSPFYLGLRWMAQKIQADFTKSIALYNGDLKDGGTVQDFYKDHPDREFIKKIFSDKEIKLHAWKMVNGVATIEIGVHQMTMGPSDFYLNQFKLNGEIIKHSDFRHFKKFEQNLFDILSKRKSTSSVMDFLIAKSFASNDQIFREVLVNSAGVVTIGTPEYDCGTKEAFNKWQSWTSEMMNMINANVEEADDNCRSGKMPFDSDHEFVKELQHKLNHNTDVTEQNLIFAILGQNGVKAGWTDPQKKAQHLKLLALSKSPDSCQRLNELIHHVPLFDKDFGVANQCTAMAGTMQDRLLGIKEKMKSGQLISKETVEALKNTTFKSPIDLAKAAFEQEVCPKFDSLKYCIENDIQVVVCNRELYKKNKSAWLFNCVPKLGSTKVHAVVNGLTRDGKLIYPEYRIETPRGKRGKGSAVAQ